MDVVSLEAGLAFAPPEFLDIITEKVRKKCPKSFQALENTCRTFRDSARRCTKSLVEIMSNDKETQIDSKPERESGSTSPSAQLLEEIKKRPGLSKLVVMEPKDSEWRRGSPVLEALSSTSWFDCEVFGIVTPVPEPTEFSGGYTLFPWEGSYGEHALSGSKASVRKLTLTNFDFNSTNSELAETIQGFPFLKSLKLQGYGQIGEPLELENLVKLDVSNLMTGPPAMEMVHSIANTAAVPQDLVWRLPKLQNLSAPVLCLISEASGKLLVLSSLKNCCSLPSTLETLELVWTLTLRFTGGLWPFVDQSFSHVLESSDCPLLRSICVRMSPDVEAPDMSAERVRSLFTAECLRIFSASPQLENVIFNRSNGEEMVKWERETLGAGV